MCVCVSVSECVCVRVCVCVCVLVWLSLWHINPCSLFNDKSSLYIYIRYT